MERKKETNVGLHERKGERQSSGCKYEGELMLEEMLEGSQRNGCVPSKIRENLSTVAQPIPQFAAPNYPKETLSKPCVGHRWPVLYIYFIAIKVILN